MIETVVASVVSAVFIPHDPSWDSGFGEGNARDTWRCTMSDGSEVDFEFYGDEISFAKSEILGKTWNEMYDLRRKKDVAYMRGDQLFTETNHPLTVADVKSGVVRFRNSY